MKVPKTLLVIGAFHLLEYRTMGTYKGNRPLQRSFKDYLIATDRHHRALYLFQNAMTGKKQIIRDKSGKQGGFIHTGVEYEIPTNELKKIGLVESIQYTSEWWEGNLSKYEHIFTAHPALYADSKTRFKVMAIKPTKGRIVSGEGITG